jgi:hypothetical protein
VGYTNELLLNVRRTTDAQDEPLAEARTRLNLARAVGGRFHGALRTYASGSLAHHTVTDPVSDGDGGLVLNRLYYPSLGPEGGGQTPTDVTRQLCDLLSPEIRKIYPEARCGTSKRGPKITFGEPVKGQDPSVDLVVALTRREGSGLWIPNLDMDRWEPSDPEEHVRLLSGGSTSLRRTRREVIRLAKVWNKQWSDPAFSSFHLSALALEHVTPGMGVAAGLHATFENGARFLATGRNTTDPARVSKPLKIVLASRETAVRRIRVAGQAMAEALEHDDDQDKVTTALSRVFRNYIDAPASDRLGAAVAALRSGSGITTSTVGLAGAALSLPSTRAFGGQRPW